LYVGVDNYDVGELPSKKFDIRDPLMKCQDQTSNLEFRSNVRYQTALNSTSAAQLAL